jgi:hypothetical protein
MPVIQPSAKTVPLLRAVVLALKATDKATRSDISRETRTTLNSVWREAVATHAGGNRMDGLTFVKGARIAAGNPSRAMAATSRRALSGGFTPDIHGRLLEFGADPNKTATYSRKSRGGKSHRVTRHTTRGLPARNRRGRVVYPAFAEVAPRMVSMWVQITVRNIHKALEER